MRLVLPNSFGINALKIAIIILGFQATRLHYAHTRISTMYSGKETKEQLPHFKQCLSGQAERETI